MSGNDDLRGRQSRTELFFFVSMHVCKVVITLGSDVADPNAGHVPDVILHLELRSGCDLSSPLQKPMPTVQKQTLGRDVPSPIV